MPTNRPTLSAPTLDEPPATRACCRLDVRHPSVPSQPIAALAVRPAAEIEQNWNLNISRYVDTSTTEKQIDVPVAVPKLRELASQRGPPAAAMKTYLAGVGIRRPTADARIVPDRRSQTDLIPITTESREQPPTP